MCGICGVFSFKERAISQELIDRVSLTMKHRGPDGSGSFLSQRIGLGHRRLSIIDLEGGAQPITNEDGSLRLVFNGEIYNYLELREELKGKGHRFRTQSDTEVIVHGYEEWGLDCVTRFNGIFAFALWDAKINKLFLARDHLGVKPLYYFVSDEKFIFSSEIKALLEDKDVPRAVNLEALGELFTYRYVPSPNTLFRDVRKLPPAHLMVVTSEGFTTKRYWKRKPCLRTRYREADLIEEYQSLLEDAVRLQLRSDVPVGLFLSAGIDSGALLAIMSEHSTGPVHTFTIGFENGHKTNETDDARQLAEVFGAHHTEMIVGPQDYRHYFERYLWDLEEPVGNETAAAFHFVSSIASNQVKVALTGQGADELWAGYHRHIGVKLSNVYSRLPQVLTRRILNPLIERLPRAERLKRGANSLYEQDVLTRFAKIYSFYTAEMKAQLFKPWIKEYLSDGFEQVKETLRPLYSDVEDLDPITQMLYIDTRASLPDDLLMVADKTSMANSLEVRVPFLDFRLVEFVETLPPGLKLKGFEGKYLHKKSLQKWLPKSYVYKKKKGFANPIDKWLQDRMQPYLKETLLSDNAAVHQYFDKGYIARLTKMHADGKQDYLRQLYLLLSFELWHRQFISP